MRAIIAIIFSIILVACAPKMVQQTFAGKKFESPRGHIYGGNKLYFDTDSTFRYAGYGPAVFVSAGYWRYDATKHEIVLVSDAKLINLLPREKFDSMWVDLRGKIINVKSANKILFEEIVYTLKQ